MLDVHSIGAGGGSLARVSPSGSLQVGPDSAGADPGPVCYDRGGHEPTVTDAHLVLGRLSPALLDGELPLNRDAAYDAIRQRVAEPLDLSVEEAASGILEILNHTMVGAIRAISIERGYDPRDFALLACGGAGPLHAGRVAELLGIPHVIVPCQAGVLSTQGLLSSDIKNDYVRTLMQRQDVLELQVIGAALDALESQARAWLTAEGIAAPDQNRLCARQICATPTRAMKSPFLYQRGQLGWRYWSRPFRRFTPSTSVFIRTPRPNSRWKLSTSACRPGARLGLLSPDRWRTTTVWRLNPRRHGRSIFPPWAVLQTARSTPMTPYRPALSSPGRRY